MTLSTPVRAPAGTSTFTDVGVTSVGTAVTGPAKVTSVAPARLEPLIVRRPPTGNDDGAKEVTRGVDRTVAE